MSGPCCDNCVYSVFDPELWRRLMWLGEPIFPRCANHPDHPGELREVPGVACCNYRRKPKLPQGEAVRMIPLADGFYAYVDAKNYDWLSQWSWHLAGGGYVARREKGKRVYMHRQIMRPPRNMVVDHIDGNRANNCEFNLRVCTQRENQRNQRKHINTRSRFKGVYYDKRCDRYYAQFWDGCRLNALGYFDDDTEAARTYDRAAVGCFGEFARVNFPREWPPERRAQVHAEWQETEGKSRKEKGKSKRAKGKGPAHKPKTHDAPPKTNRAATRGRKKETQETKSAGVEEKKGGRPPTPE